MVTIIDKIISISDPVIHVLEIIRNKLSVILNAYMSFRFVPVKAIISRPVTVQNVNDS